MHGKGTSYELDPRLWGVYVQNYIKILTFTFVDDQIHMNGRPFSLCDFHDPMGEKSYHYIHIHLEVGEKCHE